MAVSRGWGPAIGWVSSQDFYSALDKRSKNEADTLRELALSGRIGFVAVATNESPTDSIDIVLQREEFGVEHPSREDGSDGHAEEYVGSLQERILLLGQLARDDDVLGGHGEVAKARVAAMNAAVEEFRTYNSLLPVHTSEAA